MKSVVGDIVRSYINVKTRDDNTYSNSYIFKVCSQTCERQNTPE